jgi:hypothetical protein
MFVTVDGLPIQVESLNLANNISWQFLIHKLPSAQDAEKIHILQIGRVRIADSL